MKGALKPPFKPLGSQGQTPHVQKLWRKGLEKRGDQFNRAECPLSVRCCSSPRKQLINAVNLDKILNGLKTLTLREYEVLNQVVSGRLNKEIASELGITIRTVKEHRGRVMEKMEANSVAELVSMIVTLRIHETRMMA